MKKKVVLDLGVDGLDVYLVDDAVNWNRTDERLFYEESDGRYVLEVAGTPGLTFKFFVHPQIGQDPAAIRAALSAKGLIFSGRGDVDPVSFRSRLWFLIPGVETAQGNNAWGKGDEIVFP